MDTEWEEKPKITSLDKQNNHCEIKVEADDTNESNEFGSNFTQNSPDSGTIVKEEFHQTIKRERESNDYESEADTEQESTDNDEDAIPNKRQRLTVENNPESMSNPIPSPSADSFNRNELNSNRSCEPLEFESSTNIQRELWQPIDRMQNITNIATNLENENMLTIQGLRKELEDLKKSYDDSQLKNGELLDRLNTVTGESDQVKHEAAKMKENHTKLITALHEIRNQETAVAMAKMEKTKQDALDLFNTTQKQHKMELDSEKERVSAATVKLAVEHEKVVKLEKNNVKIVNDAKAKMGQLESEKEELRVELKAITDKKQRFHEFNYRLKDQVTGLKKTIKNMERDNQNQFNNHNDSICKLKTNHKNELNEIHRKHNLELFSEKQRAAGNLMVEREKVTQLENVKIIAEAKVEQLENEKNMLRTRLQAILDQKSMDLESEKHRSTAEIKLLKEKHTNELAELKNTMKTMEQDKQYLRNELDNTNKSMKEFEEKLKTNHETELNQIRDQLKIELETEKRLASDKMKETLKMEYSQKFTALENQLKNITTEKVNNEAQFEQKCKQIVNDIKAEVRKCLDKF